MYLNYTPINRVKNLDSQANKKFTLFIFFLKFSSLISRLIPSLTNSNCLISRLWFLPLCELKVIYVQLYFRILYRFSLLMNDHFQFALKKFAYIDLLPLQYKFGLYLILFFLFHHLYMKCVDLNVKFIYTNSSTKFNIIRYFVDSIKYFSSQRNAFCWLKLQISESNSNWTLSAIKLTIK